MGVEYNLYDEYDDGTGTSSMARTTGYTATAMANMLLESELFTAKGVYPPEMLGLVDGVFTYVMDYLKDRNVIYTVKHNF